MSSCALFLWPLSVLFEHDFCMHHATHDPNEWPAFVCPAVLVFWVAGLGLLVGLGLLGRGPTFLPCLPALPPSTYQARSFDSAFSPLTPHTTHTHNLSTGLPRRETFTGTLSPPLSSASPPPLLLAGSYIPRPFACLLPGAIP